MEVLYVVEKLVEAQLAERRGEAARAALVAGLRPPRPSLRVVLGLTLIRLGRRLIAPTGLSAAT